MNYRPATIACGLYAANVIAWVHAIVQGLSAAPA